MMTFPLTLPMRTLQRSLVLIGLMVMLSSSNVANAFRSSSTGKTLWERAVKVTEAATARTVSRTNSALEAWSIPSMEMPSMKSTWYQECNPTARKTVYNDVFNDYGYSNSDDEDDTTAWITTTAYSSTGALYANVPRPATLTSGGGQQLQHQDDPHGRNQASHHGRRGPLRRVARWAKKQVFRS